MVTNLPQFLLAVLVISATPGPAVALIIRRTALRGRRDGAAVLVGLELGLYAWALLVASGFAVVAASETGYVVLKAIGCGVLISLAVRSFRSWWHERRTPTSLTAERSGSNEVDRSRHPIWAVGEGLAVQLANPKAAVFLLALYPQFVPPDRSLFTSTLVLGVLQVAVETVVYGALVLGVAHAGSWFRASVVRRRIEAVNGAVLTGLAVRLARTPVHT